MLHVSVVGSVSQICASKRVCVRMWKCVCLSVPLSVFSPLVDVCVEMKSEGGIEMIAFLHGLGCEVVGANSFLLI